MHGTLDAPCTRYQALAPTKSNRGGNHELNQVARKFVTIKKINRHSCNEVYNNQESQPSKIEFLMSETKTGETSTEKLRVVNEAPHGHTTMLLAAAKTICV